MSWGFTSDPFGTVLEVIKAWRPTNCKTENDFEKSLLKELRNKLKNQKSQPQYGSGRQRVDIVVQKKVPIEIKMNLKSTAALQRTIGQLEQYLEDWKRLFLVLCGDIDPDLLKSLVKFASTKEDGILPNMPDNRIIIVKK